MDSTPQNPPRYTIDVAGVSYLFMTRAPPMVGIILQYFLEKVEQHVSVEESPTSRLHEVDVVPTLFSLASFCRSL